MSRRQPKQPYLGLRPFDEDDEPLFFGREALVDAALSQLEEHAFLAVVGASGSGKSSLVKAGVLPAVRQGFLLGSTDWTVLKMRPGYEPYRRLAEQLNVHLPGTGAGTSEVLGALRRSERGLLNVLASGPSNRVLIVVDQFEELFAFRRATEGTGRVAERDEAAAFVRLLLHSSADDESLVRVVITMRSDFIGDCDTFLRLPEAISRSQFLVPRLDRSQMEEAIVRPSQIRGAQYEPFTFASGLVVRIINDAGDRQDQLPLMQHALMRSWKLAVEGRQSDRPLEVAHEHYEDAGGISKALSLHADAGWRAIEPDTRLPSLTRRVFLLLCDVSPDGQITRRRPRVREVLDATGASRRELARIVQVFQEEDRNFLLPPLNLTVSADSAAEALEDDVVLDISHESLIRQWDMFNAWVAEEATSVAMLTRLREDAIGYSNGQKGLLRDPELTVALRWLSDTQPNRQWAARYHGGLDRALEYIEQSRKAHEQEAEHDKEAERREVLQELRAAQAERQARAQRMRAWGAGVLSLAFAGLAAWGLLEKREADSGARAIRISSLATFSEQFLQSNRERAARFALAAVDAPRAGVDPVTIQRAITALRNAVQGSFLNTLGSHADWVRSVAVLADGRVVSGGDDNTVNVWDWRSPGDPVEVGQHDDYVMAVTVLPDDRIVSGSRDGQLTVWSLGSTIHSVNLGRLGDSVLTLASLRDGRVVSGGRDGQLRVWNPDTPQKSVLLGEHGAAVMATVPLDDRRVASGSGDGVLRVWNLSRPGEPVELGKHGQVINGLAVLQDGRVVSVSDDGVIRIWDIAQPGRAVVTVDASGDILAVKALPDRRIVFGDSEGRIRLWDLKTADGKDLGRHEDYVRSLAVLPDSRIVSGGDDNRIMVWQSDAVNEQNVLGTHDNWVRALAILPDGRVASGGDDNRVLLWNPSQPGDPSVLGEHADYVMALLALSDGTVVSGDDDGFLRLWNPARLGLPTEIGEHGSSVAGVALLPDGHIVSVGGDRIAIWELGGRGAPAALFAERRFEDVVLKGVAVLPDGRIVTGDDAGRILILDPTLQGALQDLATSVRSRNEGRTNPRESDEESASPVLAVAVSANGRVASGDEEGRIRLWDVREPGKALELGTHDDYVRSVAFLPDGSVIAGSDDGQVRIWSVGSSARSGLVGTHNDYVRAVAALDHERVVSGGDDNLVRVWSWKIAFSEAEARERARAMLLNPTLTAEDRQLAGLP